MQANWCVDDGDYRAAYVEAVLHANTLSPETAKLLSTPQAIALTPEYLSSPVKIMIMGQETADNYMPLIPGPDRSGGWAFHSWANSIGSAIAFNYAINESQRSGPFWRAYREISDGLGIPSVRHTAWSNISKVQLIGGKTASIESLPIEERMKVIFWQRKLFVAELNFAQPDVVIMLTGRMTWMIDHLLNSRHEAEWRNKSDVNRHALGTQDNQFYGRVDVPQFPHVVFANTYHPNARIEATVKTELRAGVIDFVNNTIVNRETASRPSGFAAS